MKPAWQLVCTLTFVILTLGVGPALAQNTDSDQPPKPPTLESLGKQLDEIQKALKPLEGVKSSVVYLESRLRSMDEALQDELKKIRSGAYETNLKLSLAQGDILELRKQLAQIRQELDAVAKSSAATSRISTYAGPQAPTNPPGRIRLVNTYGLPVQVVVNGYLYEVTTGQTRIIEGMEPGPFYYEVLGIQGRRDLALAPGETFTVTIYPR
jgi:hypothetical protein